MPVTARLSKRFYEQFGDELTNELVDWLNAVDATYRSDLRDLNENNFARLEAKLDQRAAESDARMERRAAGLEAKMDGIEARLDRRIDVLEARLDSRISDLRGDLTGQMAKFEARMIRWMFTMWTGTMLAMGGLLVAILRK